MTRHGHENGCGLERAQQDSSSPPVRASLLTHSRYAGTSLPLTPPENGNTLSSTGAPGDLRSKTAGRRGFHSPMRLFFLLIGAALITGCAAPRPPAGTPTPSLEPRTPAPVSLSPPPELPARPSFTPGATPEPHCLLRPGSILVGELENPDLPRALPYRIYLPPCYEAREDADFPTLYLLHGLTYDDSQWDVLGVDEEASALIRRRRIPPMLIVMPWERKGADFELSVVDYLIPFIDATYRTRDNPRGRAIGGLSRGGGWALRIGLKHPSLFAAIGLHSPAVLVPDLYDLPTWVEPLSPQERPRLWIDAGERDPLKPSILELVEALELVNYDFEWTLMPGDHSAAYWSAHVQDYLTWYASEW